MERKDRKGREALFGSDSRQTDYKEFWYDVDFVEREGAVLRNLQL
jgi:hypothetical protein